MRKAVDVAVVGAGLAGLAAADRLLRGGHWIAAPATAAMRGLMERAGLQAETRPKPQAQARPERPAVLLPGGGAAAAYDWGPLRRALTAAAAAAAAAHGGAGISLAAALERAGFAPRTEADRAALWYAADYEWGRPAGALPARGVLPAAA